MKASIHRCEEEAYTPITISIVIDSKKEEQAIREWAQCHRLDHEQNEIIMALRTQVAYQFTYKIR